MTTETNTETNPKVIISIIMSALMGILCGFFIGLAMMQSSTSDMYRTIYNHECSPNVYNYMLDRDKYPGKLVCQDKNDPTKLNVVDVSWLENKK